MSDPLLAILHLCDSLFPIGGFAYSDGLEAATSAGVVLRGDGLREWLDVCLDETIGRAEGPTLLGAWTAFRDGRWERLSTLDEEVMALRPSSAARRSSRAMGLRLLTTWQALHPDARLADALTLVRDGALGPALPLAFAGACVTSGVGQRASAEAFAYTRLAATISAAMRLMPVGQIEAHSLLAGVLDRVPETIDAMIGRGSAIESFAPEVDIAVMTQQYLHSRLFRS